MLVKYAIYGSGYSWINVILGDLRDHKAVRFNNCRIPIKNTLLRFMCKVHYSDRLNRYFSLPFKAIWYRLFDFADGDIDEQGGFYILYDKCIATYDLNFIIYLKRRHPNCKVVYVFTDTVKNSTIYYRKSLERLLKNVDCAITYNKLDADAYGISYYPYTYSKATDKVFKLEYDVFYIGNSKERFGRIIEIYDQLEKCGVRCYFYIVGVKTEERVNRNGIHYGDPVSYLQALEMMLKCKAILEVNQIGTSDSTIRLLEAITYNKFFITNNVYLVDQPLFNDKYMCIFINAADINIDMIKGNMPQYHASVLNTFSPKAFLKALSQSTLLNSSFTMQEE
jgi:phage FluMu protein Com